MDLFVAFHRPLLGEVGFVLKGHTGTIRIVKFAPQSLVASSTLLLGSAGAGDFRTRIWDIEAG
jgi:hypothetical protein